MVSIHQMQAIDSMHSAKQTGTNRAWVALLSGGIAGVLWAVAQFAVSEIFYRLSMAPLPTGATEAFESMSNAVAWPASHIYDAVDARRLQETLDATLANDALASEPRAKLEELAARGALEPEHDDHWELYEVFDSLDIDASVETHMEYLIYGGVCAAWGMGVGTVVAALVWMLRRPRLSPEPMNRL